MAFSPVFNRLLVPQHLEIFDTGTAVATPNAGNGVFGIVRLSNSGGGYSWPATHFGGPAAGITVATYDKDFWQPNVTTAQEVLYKGPSPLVVGVKLTGTIAGSGAYSGLYHIKFYDNQTTPVALSNHDTTVTGNGTTPVPYCVVDTIKLNVGCKLSIFAAIDSGSVTMTFAQPFLRVYPLYYEVD